MAMSNKDLRAAKKQKKAEFYTQLKDVEKELEYYKNEFKGKVVFCNCDDPYESNFFKYFAMNFNYLGIKKLIATCFVTSSVKYSQLTLFDINELKGEAANQEKKPYKVEISEVNDENGDGAIDLADVEYLIKNKKNILTLLHGDGDFRSQECVELLKQADIVVTNPPFPLFREFVALMQDFQKDFIIIGNTNALTYKEVFKLFQSDSIRTGYTNFNVGMYFYVPDNYEKYHRIIDGKKAVRVSNSCWYTTLPVKKHNDMLVSVKKYSPKNYKKYYNFDAININNYNDIPENYDGMMGVPVTFLDKFNPQQFELIGLGISNSGIEIGVNPYTLEHSTYRKLVQHKCAVNGDLYMLDEEGHPDVPYARIIIRRKHHE